MHKKYNFLLKNVPIHSVRNDVDLHQKIPTFFNNNFPLLHSIILFQKIPDKLKFNSQHDAVGDPINDFASHISLPALDVQFSPQFQPLLP